LILTFVNKDMLTLLGRDKMMSAIEGVLS